MHTTCIIVLQQLWIYIIACVNRRRIGQDVECRARVIVQESSEYNDS